MRDSDDALRFGVYRLHPTQGLTREGSEVRVTRQALRVLWLLACRSGETVTKEELFRDAWPGVAVSDAALTSCIRELRRALQDDAGHPRFIETRHRLGFRFLPSMGSMAAHRQEPGAATPHPDLFVGRERELSELASALTAATAGVRRLVVVRGEAGIGKTTLLRAFLGSLAGRTDTVATGATCAEATGGSEPYRPLLDAVSTLSRASPVDADGARLRRYAPHWWTHFPAFQTTPQPPPPGLQIGAVTTTRMSRELTDYLEALADSRTLVLWIDDLQWADAVTLDWLVSFMVRVEPARVLVIAGLRDEHQTPHDLLSRLHTKPSCQTIVLGGLDRSAVRDIVLRARGDGADADPLAVRLHAETEGHPLFISLLVDEQRRMPTLAPQAASTPPADGDSGRRLPERLRSVIETQITHLDAGEIDLLEVASLSTSLDWPAALVAAGLERAVIDVERGLLHLARRRAFIEHAGVTRWPDGTVSDAFRFRHALHRDVFHGRMSAHRRALVHAHIGTRLEQAFGDRAHELATSLARHFEESGQCDKAVAWLIEAARGANQVGAAENAARLLMRAVTLLRTDSRSAEQYRREADVQIQLGGALMAARGWGAREVEQAYARALELCGHRGDDGQRFAVDWGLWLYRWGRGELFEAQAHVQRLKQVTAALTDRTLLLQLHHAQWATEFCLGNLDAAIAHAEEGWALAGEDRGEAMLAFGNHHAGVCARGFAARALALGGDGGSARRRAEEAVTRARDIAHPFTLALALVFSGAAHQTLGDETAATRFAQSAESVSLEHGFELLLAWARALKGWTMRRQSPADAVRLVQDAVSSAAATGSGQFQTWLLALLAETELAAGAVDEGMNTVDLAFACGRATGERFNERELERVRGALTAARA